mgnify:FL=1
MYKVFVNEKKLSLSNSPIESEKKLHYDGKSSLEIAIDLLENTSVNEINIYHEDLEVLWKDFSGIFRIIEAAGGIVLNDKKEILFIKRLGKWDLPKGKIEKGESLEEAALREIEEETGLEEVEIVHFLNTTYHIYTERNGDKILKTTHWFLMNYYGIKSPKPQIEEGILDVSWKNKEEIKEKVLGKTFRNIELTLSEYWKN